jgi:hypothetical protein
MSFYSFFFLLQFCDCVLRIRIISSVHAERWIFLVVLFRCIWDKVNGATTTVITSFLKRKSISIPTKSIYYPTMFSRIAPIVARTAVARSTVAPTAVRGFASLTTAGEAAKLSGYSNIEFRIQEDAMVIEAVQQFAANNIGCLVTVNEAGT